MVMRAPQGTLTVIRVDLVQIMRERQSEYYPACFCVCDYRKCQCTCKNVMIDILLQYSQIQIFTYTLFQQELAIFLNIYSILSQRVLSS